MGHTYLVTGASRGLGAEFVRQLRRAGPTVIAGVRDPERARDAASDGARVVSLDVAQPATFGAFAASLATPVDVLVNTAGVAAADASLTAIIADAFESVVQMHKELAPEGFTVVSLDPGWNRTDIGGDRARLDPSDTVRGMVTVMDRLRRDDSGTFVGYDGELRPW